MTTFAAPYRRAPGLLLITVLHLALLYAFLQTRRQPDHDDAPRGPAIQWLRQTPPAPARARPAPRPAGKPATARQAAPLARPRPAPPLPGPVPAPVQIPAPVPAPAASQLEAAAAVPPAAEPAIPARPGAADILAQAKRDVGKIDKDLRKEFPQRGVEKFDDTGFKRMQQGFAEAYAAVPPKWYEASKIEEIGANEARGSRTYKITSALGTLCVTTRAGKQGETMIGMCPK